MHFYNYNIISFSAQIRLYGPWEWTGSLFILIYLCNSNPTSTVSPKPPLILSLSLSLSVSSAMLISRSSILSNTLHLRFFSQAATAALLDDAALAPLTYLDGFPTPDPKFAETIYAIPRPNSGKNISAKERKKGRVPSVVFEQEDGQHGGNKRLISVQTNQIRKLVNLLGRSFFLSRLFDLQVHSEFGSDDVIEKVRVLPRMVLVSF